MSVDKSQVREDYLRGFSVRMLAAKYGVPKSTINDWIKRFGWVQENKIPKKKVCAILEAERIESKAHDQSSDKKSDKNDRTVSVNRTVSETLITDGDFERLRRYTIKLLGKADQLLDLDDALAPRDLKSLSSMLLDVRTLLNVLSPREAAEQEMRLAALRKQAEKDEETNESQGVTVRFETEGAET